MAVAEAALAEERRSTPLDRVYAYANRREFPVEPTAQQQTAVTSATAALGRARKLAREIDGELPRWEARLRQCQNGVTQAMAPVVV